MSRKDTSIMTINVSTLSFIKVLIILAVIGILWLIRDVLAILFVALILSSALSPMVVSFEKHGVPRLLGVLIIYIIIFSIFGIAITLLIPPVVQEYSQLAARFPSYSDRIIQIINTYYPEVDVIEQFKAFFRSIQSGLLQSAGGIVTKIMDIVQGFIAFMLIFVVTFYMIMQEGALWKAFHMVTPIQFRPFLDELMRKVQKKIGLWLRAQAILSLVIFSLVFIGLTALGVDYALTLAVVAGLTEFMPIIGPIVGSVPAIFIAFAQSPILALWVTVMYLLIQYAENHFIVPRVMQTTIGINPLVSIIALLIGAKIGGVGGILLAIPVATVLMVVVNEFIDREGEEEADLEQTPGEAPH